MTNDWKLTFEDSTAADNNFVEKLAPEQSKRGFSRTVNKIECTCNIHFFVFSISYFDPVSVDAVSDSLLVHE
jgi:hypothetical protein